MFYPLCHFLCLLSVMLAHVNFQEISSPVAPCSLYETIDTRINSDVPGVRAKLLFLWYLQVRQYTNRQSMWLLVQFPSILSIILQF